MYLLTEGNPKTQKGVKKGYLTAVLHLAPWTLSGRNVCPMATPGCRSTCLNTAGRGGIFKKGETTNKIQLARLSKTVRFFDNRTNFMADLVKDIRAHQKKAALLGLTPCVRLNGTSDIRWETIELGQGVPNLMHFFPHIQFYDYTKIANRKNLPSNYHLTFSLSEDNEKEASEQLIMGRNVAVVFRTAKFPRTYLGREVIDGDENDLRFLDPMGVVVGLRAKGRAKKDTTGFVKETA